MITTILGGVRKLAPQLSPTHGKTKLSFLLWLSQRCEGKGRVYRELEVWFKASLSMQGDLIRFG